MIIYVNNFKIYEIWDFLNQLVTKIVENLFLGRSHCHDNTTNLVS